ncbi:hypothetical protein, partial [Enterobacter hormaechei]|uniref:hypothetical protein n=1 Tax=Enterobacter hormaechei TaxID=158836 RepID=UPI001BD65940
CFSIQERRFISFETRSAYSTKKDKKALKNKHRFRRCQTLHPEFELSCRASQAWENVTKQISY